MAGKDEVVIEDEFPQDRQSARASSRRPRDDMASGVSDVLKWVHSGGNGPAPTEQKMTEAGVLGALRKTVHVISDLRATIQKGQAELASSNAENARIRASSLIEIERARQSGTRARCIAESEEDLFGATGAQTCGQLMAIDVVIPGAPTRQTTYVKCIHPGMPVYGGHCAAHAHVACEHVMKAAAPAQVEIVRAPARKHKGKSFASAAAASATH
jgi:hypothetical protein